LPAFPFWSFFLHLPSSLPLTRRTPCQLSIPTPACCTFPRLMSLFLSLVKTEDVPRGRQLSNSSSFSVLSFFPLTVPHFARVESSFRADIYRESGSGVLFHFRSFDLLAPFSPSFLFSFAFFFSFSGSIRSVKKSGVLSVSIASRRFALFFLFFVFPPRGSCLDL